VERRLSEGQRLLRQGRWEEAERALEPAAAAAPEYVWPHLYLALARADGGRAEEALPEIDRALELLPESAVLHVFRGRILCDAGREEEALAALRHAQSLDPRYIVARGYEALALLQQEKVAEAWERWNAAPAEPPSALLGRMLLAAERLACRRPAAPEEPAELPEIPGSKPGGRHGVSRAAMQALKRARRFYFKERLADAQAAYLQAVRADPSLGDAWLELAVVTFERGDYEMAREALERYRQAAAVEETDPAYRAYRAGCEARLGSPEAALGWLEGADARQPVVPYTRGLAFLALGRFPEARYAFSQFAAMTPRVVQARLKAVMRDA
jgi:tetratricopeptide (TPR) repeat protein